LSDNGSGNALHGQMVGFDLFLECGRLARQQALD
jgi:hypothetical protein